MYGIFTYKTRWFLGQMLVNIQYMEHMGNVSFQKELWFNEPGDVFSRPQSFWPKEMLFEPGVNIGSW